jgi:hypothetical protein
MDAQQLDLIRHVCKRPGIYVGPGTLPGVCAYLVGLDTATGCLTGFREWLIPRVDGGNDLAWPGLVDRLLGSEDVNQDQRLARLGELIAEFYEFTREHGGSRGDLTRVYVRYHAWLLNRPWYWEGAPGYVAPYDGMPVPRDPHQMKDAR